MTAAPEGWLPLASLPLAEETDVVVARQRAREVAALLGFGVQDQTRLATAVSEAARETTARRGRGWVRFGVDRAARALSVRISARGGTLAPESEALAWARRLVTRVRAGEDAEGITVTLEKALPPGMPDAGQLEAVAAELASRPADPLGEVHRQNRELMAAMEELRLRQDDLQRLGRELEDTNRGVVALYAELDERAAELRAANQVKAQFLSYMSHEFRTPLDSVIALSGLLLDRVDGPLTEEQEKQASFIRRSARDLLEMVDDLLATARMDAGQVTLRPGDFTVAELFNALRATLRPLLGAQAVELAFEAQPGLPPLFTDEAKLSQILRNFVSNALKFTERGTVRVSAALAEGEGRMVFSVADTGIGIAPEDQDRIFQDFTQVESPVQRRVRGTGLGLPLSRRLAELLGGRVWVRSAPGEGSVFSVEVPVRLDGAPEDEAREAAAN